MKKLAALVLLLLVLFLLPTALADGNPGFLQVLPEGEPGTFAFSTDEIQQKSAADFVITGKLTTGQAVSIQSAYSFPGYTHTMLLAVQVDWSDYYQVVYCNDVTKFNYRFYQPGRYLLVAQIEGYDYAYCYLNVTGYDYVAAKAKQLVAGCSGSSDYEKALYLYEYLAKNSYYDSTLVYHGADVLLFRGFGVCQSFAIAYLDLL
ncbi:MAG: transglutaminase-like domain-containing protein [Clostridia bacterium]|nr:transglutaminase-like domain-containing protein [Clostridia bacterium]